ncbi:MAG: hypothetical protein N3F66_07255 [Spirochaetes bacterium]|nr:hypothetical protein [Spirochaetota bacterium]
MNLKLSSIVIIVLLVIRPLHAYYSFLGNLITYAHLPLLVQDSTTKKDKPPASKGNDENPDDNHTNDDTFDHDDNDIDEYMEDIPDDFYDYQEENF